MLAVLAPHFYRRIDKSHAVVLVLFAYLLSVLVALSPFLVGEDYVYYAGAAMASPNTVLANSAQYMWVTDSLSLYLPTFLIIVSVCLISWRVRHMKTKDNRVTTTLLTVLCAYIACFLVYFLWIVLRSSGLMENFSIPTQLYLQNFSLLILNVHSAVNPIIYAFKARQFKVELRHINDQAIVRCISFLLRIRKTSNITTIGTLNMPTVHFSGMHSEKEFGMKSFNDIPMVDS